MLRDSPSTGVTHGVTCPKRRNGMTENRLTELQLRAAKPRERDQYLADGGGLYARVLRQREGGRKRIVFQYRFKLHGKTGYYHCGTYPEISLAAARERRRQARNLVRAGVHPAVEARAQRAAEAARAHATSMEKTVEGLLADWQEVFLQRHRKDRGALIRDFLE